MTLKQLLPGKLHFPAALIHLLFFLAPVWSVSAESGEDIHVHTGVRAYTMLRQEDSFSRGIQKIRPGLYPESYFSLSRSDSMNSAGMQELFLRIDNLLGEGHSGGFAVGNFSLPVIRSKEIRFNKEGFLRGATSAQSDFTGNYLIFNYDYQIGNLLAPRGVNRNIRSFLSGWELEAGGGFGITGPLIWKMNGWEYTGSYFSESTLSQFRSYQESVPGTVSELRLGFLNRSFLSGHLSLQAGISLRYMYHGGFTGSVRGSDGTWYFDQSGRLISAGNTQIVYLLNEREALNYQEDTDPAHVYLPAAGPLDMHHSMGGFYFSASVRF